VAAVATTVFVVMRRQSARRDALIDDLVRTRRELAATERREGTLAERERLAREIHDTLAQSLAALTMQLEVADERAAGKSDQRLADAVTRSLELARSALEEARRSVLDLRAAPLEGRTLEQALEQLASEVPGAGALNIQIVADGPASEEEELPASIAVGLYRIAQQAVANVARHAGARHARIRLDREPGRVGLRVEDDGVGFDPAEVPSGRFGLVGMSERARLLGGTLRLESSPGAGTVVEVSIPR
jgi:signal transduction histidine kinase